MTCSVSAILLAAGSSRRMGTVKQMLPLAGKPVIRHCLDTIIASGVEDIVVVLSSQAKETEEAIRHFPVTIVFNNDPSSEMAESVRIGLRSMRGVASGVLVCLSDQPLIRSDTLKVLISRHGKAPDKIVVPIFKNRRGHPCLFPRRCAEEVFEGFTLKEIMQKDRERVLSIEVQDEGILLDMDTEEDYKTVSRLMFESP
jgi:molybdenum cofactor cytidylyltransferase